jgi:hypothetical protein
MLTLLLHLFCLLDLLGKIIEDKVFTKHDTCWTEGIAEVIENLLTKCKDLSSVSNAMGKT